MPDIESTTESGAARTARVPLWVLIAVFLAGVALLSVIQPAAAHAQTAADSTVLLNWTAPGDDGTVGRATTYDIRYRTVAIAGTDTTTWWNAATQVTGEPVPGTAGASDSMRVRGLSPLTTYYFMIRAADEVPNWSGYSNVAVRSTSGDATAPATIADLTVTGTTGTSVSVRWTAPGDDGTTGTAASYDVRYSTSAITSSNWSSALQATGEPAPAAAGTSQSFTISGLSGSRTYYVAIKTTDDAGNVSVLSNVVNGTTSDTVAPAPVRDLSRLDGSGLSSEMLALADADSSGAADLP
ncbi:MAG TPA: fibronectin type III domain-containing protein [Candidatus Binatia bacterium]|nr:fibronectin type III domain-containing protein [Candidatus Binatia bacterium]